MALHSRTRSKRRTPLLIAALALSAASGLAACSKDDSSASAAPAPTAETTIASAASTTGIRRVSPADFASVLEAEPARVLLDLRTPDEVATGRLAGARTLDFYAGTFDRDLATLDRATPYAVYCRSGNRSAQAVAKMKLLGFQDVVELDGGIVAWQDAGRPVTA